MTLLNDMHTDWNVKDNDTRPAIATLHTNGRGYYTARAASVRITGLSLGYVNNSGDFAELRVHFNTDDWRTDRDNLIYTDTQFSCLCFWRVLAFRLVMSVTANKACKDATTFRWT
jgi:hypothetical protein